MTKREEQMQEFDRLVARMQDIRKRKNEDYANEGDSFANFRAVEAYGIPAWVGIFVRLTDKVSRIGEVVRKREAKEPVTFAIDEQMEETCIDLANYALLLAVAYAEYERALLLVPASGVLDEAADAWRKAWAL